MEIRWLQLALDDLAAIIRFIAEDDPAAALARAAAIREGVDRLLATFPAGGRVGRWAETRELVLPPYVITYRMTEDALEILAVLHSRQAWPEETA